MTQHTELIDRLRGPIGTIPPDIQIEAANALEAQAREIAELKAQESELCTLYGLAQAECQKLRAEADGLRKDAALVAARERERCENHIEDCEPPIAVHGARVEIGITTRIAYANSIRALNTEGEVLDATTAQKGGE